MYSIQPIPCLVSCAGRCMKLFPVKKTKQLWHGGQHGISSWKIPQKLTLWTASFITHCTSQESTLYIPWIFLMLLSSCFRVMPKDVLWQDNACYYFPACVNCSGTPLAGWVMHLEYCDVVLWVGHKSCLIHVTLGANPSHMQRYSHKNFINPELLT